MIKGMVGDDSMSNLTSASNEASISSSNRAEIGSALYPQHLAPTNIQTQPAPANKKKRNLPGNPDPEAEVIALSPKSLLATNRFVCEICNKGFQRDQNLQLHRRGHNLPWKLKQRTNKEVKKKVYVCPEPSCVHHHPSRALGDLTGIKKHFCRKHGEKKWKCEKCSKRYAVQSDWKAHSKICGTREYRCDCGTLFSRRDSFITHRAFCDALAEESVRTTNPLISSSSTSHHLNLHTLQNFQLKQEQQQQLSNFNLLPPHPSNELSSQLFIHNPTSSSSNNIFGAAAAATSAHMSATALLQKAAQIGVTSSNSNSAPSFFSPTTIATTTGMAGGGDLASREYHQFQNISANNSTMAPTTGNFVTGHGLASYGDDNNNNKGAFGHFSVNSGFMEQIHDMQNMMAATTTTTALPCTTNSVGFDEGFGGANNPLIMRGKENNEGLTRDFLGLRAFPHHRDFLNNTTTTGLHHQMGSSSSAAAASFDHQQHNQNQSPWQN
ncbi:protein indeterminate-domain 7 [Nicotiana tabacum]|uniref:Protein indeterminate-domain 7 n=2 Tax=Nicotiana TaxID=4085 RepID=A0A1S3YNL0_TOBAC|nr:PREDICTED: zinc finger protein NUTCRACKER-like [Nicotiana sylvestris]XP_016453602.1 PREDICTED: protein indeterminate-domain 7-like [Nicotiana tabacum]